MSNVHNEILEILDKEIDWCVKNMEDGKDAISVDKFGLAFVKGLKQAKFLINEHKKLYYKDKEGVINI